MSGKKITASLPPRQGSLAESNEETKGKTTSVACKAGRSEMLRKLARIRKALSLPELYKCVVSRKPAKLGLKKRKATHAAPTSVAGPGNTIY